VFHEKVREGYLSLARQEPERFRIIDAARDEAGVWKQIRGVMCEVLEV